MPRRSPHEFSWIIAKLNGLGRTPLLVAGQAVNLWGILMSPWDEEFNSDLRPCLAELLPFTSDDMELMEIKSGDLNQFEEIAHKHVNDPFSRIAPAEAGTWILRGTNGEEFKIQVMARVLGLDAKTLEDHSLPVELADGAEIELPDPIVLLQGKLANLSGLPQRGRQDLKHCQILLCCIRAFLGTMAQNPNSEDGLLLDRLKRAKNLLTSPLALKHRDVLDLDIHKCLPLLQLRQHARTHPRIQRWLDANILEDRRNSMVAALTSPMSLATLEELFRLTKSGSTQWSEVLTWLGPEFPHRQLLKGLQEMEKVPDLDKKLIEFVRNGQLVIEAFTQQNERRELT